MMDSVPLKLWDVVSRILLAVEDFRYEHYQKGKIERFWELEKRS